MQKITPCLWFDMQAEEAAKFYVAVFKNGKINSTSYYGEGAPLPAGTLLTVEFELHGQAFTALNGGPAFKFSEAVSMQIDCKDQAEVDYFWDALIADGGEESQCGWLKDKFGFSWQVVPNGFSKMMASGNKEGIARAFAAMMSMKKLDLQKLQDAYDGK